MRAARIAVIGAGAVGNEVVKNLVLLGVGAIDVYDFDRVEVHNLTRSIFLRESDVGAPKVDAVVARAREVDASVELCGIEGDFWQTLSLSRLRRYGCVVCGVDNFEARLRLNQMCLIAGVDLVNAGIDSRYATVETFPFSGAAIPSCYECHLPHSAYQRIAERYSCGWLRKAAWAERKVPTTAITASIAGAFAASVALRLGAEPTGTSRRIFLDTISGASTVSELGRQPECVGCGMFAERLRTLAVGNDWARQLSELAGSPAQATAVTLRLSDPIIIDYVCAQCGDATRAGWYVNRRAAEFDDSITLCPVCNQRAVRVAMQDEFTFATLSECFSTMAPPVKYALAAVGSEWLCLDFEED